MLLGTLELRDVLLGTSGAPGCAIGNFGGSRMCHWELQGLQVVLLGTSGAPGCAARNFGGSGVFYWELWCLQDVLLAISGAPGCAARNFGGSRCGQGMSRKRGMGHQSKAYLSWSRELGWPALSPRFLTPIVGNVPLSWEPVSPVISCDHRWHVLAPPGHFLPLLLQSEPCPEVLPHPKDTPISTFTASLPVAWAVQSEIVTELILLGLPPG